MTTTNGFNCGRCGAPANASDGGVMVGGKLLCPGCIKEEHGSFRFFNLQTRAFDGVAFAAAFWDMAAPAYCGAEFPLHDSPEAGALTMASAYDKVMENIISHATWCRQAGVEELDSMDFVHGCTELLAELGDERYRLKKMFGER